MKGAILLGLLLVACGDSEGGAADAPRPSEIRAALSMDDGSQALHLARKALNAVGDDAELHLLAATACLTLDRFSEAVEHASKGAATGPDEELLADLHWAEGKARLGLYRELRNDGEWRQANTLLERATRAGSHRAEAAYALVLMHADETLGNPDRLKRFGRLVLQLAPDSEQATNTRAVAAKRGVDL